MKVEYLEDCRALMYANIPILRLKEGEISGF